MGDDEKREPHGRAYWERHAVRYDRSMSFLGGPLPRMLELVGDAVAAGDRVLEVAAGTDLVTRADPKVRKTETVRGLIPIAYDEASVES